MSSISALILQATSSLCSSRGSMDLLQLYQDLLQRCNLAEEDFFYIIQGCPQRFLLQPDGGQGGPDGPGLRVVARTSLRLCRTYSRGEQCGGCQQLHLCKFFIYGTCRFGKGRKPCKFSHSIQSDYNFRLLRECTLHELTEDQLFLLLLQNDPQLLPEVCLHYNKGSGPHGDCSFQKDCSKVHLCQHFIQGGCRFGHACKRLHAIEAHAQRRLEERGLSGDIVRGLPSIYRNLHILAAAAAAEIDPHSVNEADQKDETQEICLHFLRNSCKFHQKCRRVHFHLPYKWEVLVADTWTELPNMEDIERHYCDPSKSHSAHQHVDFVTMTRESLPVRRLSTVSSITKPPHYSLTTRWLWYYKGECGNWLEYGQLDDKQRSTSVTSQTLEEAYLSEKTAEVKVLKGQREYLICFKDMYQRNPKHRTKRRIRRRPLFVSQAEVDEHVRKCSDDLLLSDVSV